MRKTLVLGSMLALVLMLAVCLPASAQYHFTTTALVQPARYPSAPSSTANPVRVEFTSHQPALPLPQRPAETASPAPLFSRLTWEEEDRGATLENAFRSEETPFAQQTQFPVARFFGGHVQLRGFDTLVSSENETLGPPINLPAWSISTQSHPGILVPRMEESFGLSLEFRLKSEGGADKHAVQFWRCLGWFVGSGRGCRLL